MTRFPSTRPEDCPSNQNLMFWTYWVEVDITILQGELLQVLQSHVGGLLYCLQILLTVGAAKCM